MNAIDEMIADGRLSEMVADAMPSGTTTWINGRACKIADGEPSPGLLDLARRMRDIAAAQGGRLSNAWGMRTEKGDFGFEFAIAPDVEDRIGEISWKIGTRPVDMQQAKIRLPRSVSLSFACYTDVVMAANDLHAMIEMTETGGGSRLADLAKAMGYRSAWTPDVNSLQHNLAIIPLRRIHDMEVAA